VKLRKQSESAAELSAEEQRADDLMSFAGGGLSADERAAISRMLKDALAERSATLQADDHGVLADTVDAAADELGRPPALVARELAEAKRLETVWEEWCLDRNLLRVPAGDRRRRAAETLEAIERRRLRLEERLKLPTTVGAVRQRAIAQLEELDRLESESWATVHPPFSLLDEGEPEPPRCRCGREITREDAYRIGLCEPCTAAYELLHHAKPPTIG
jgi:hypothetical protein